MDLLPIKSLWFKSTLRRKYDLAGWDFAVQLSVSRDHPEGTVHFFPRRLLALACARRVLPATVLQINVRVGLSSP